MRQVNIFTFSLLAALSLASCSNENAMPETQLGQERNTNVPEGVTVGRFVAPPATRTTAEYDAPYLWFYWTKGDKVWLHDEDETPEYIQSIGSTIETSGQDKVAYAEFYFKYKPTKPVYPIRYTGYPTSIVDQVTITPTQNQAEPNKGEHIKGDGDCGVGSFTRRADGNYDFNLSHSASYLTFTPYFSKVFSTAVRVTQVKVSADQALAGTFAFDDNGIILDSRPKANASNKSITLTLNGGGNQGFVIPTKSRPTSNAAFMVVAPGQYTNFSVEYTLYDQETKVRGTVTYKYNEITLGAGRNWRFSPDLDVRYYAADQYYMWDALQPSEHYWKGAQRQPYLNGMYVDNYAKSSGDSRWHNTVAHPGKASRLMKDNLNANELMWLAYYGTPHYDPEIWTIMGHLYAGGVWVRNLDVIGMYQKKSRSQMKAVSPKGIDFTAYSSYDNFGWFIYSNKKVIQHRPRPTNGYFYIPTTGYYTEGRLRHIGSLGYIWSSTPRQHGQSSIPQAYNFYVGKNEIHTGYGNRSNGIYLHATK